MMWFQLTGTASPSHILILSLTLALLPQPSFLTFRHAAYERTYMEPFCQTQQPCTGVPRSTHYPGSIPGWETYYIHWLVNKNRQSKWLRSGRKKDWLWLKERWGKLSEPERKWPKWSGRSEELVWGGLCLTYRVCICTYIMQSLLVLWMNGRQFWLDRRSKQTDTFFLSQYVQAITDIQLFTYSQPRTILSYLHPWELSLGTPYS